MEQEDRISKLPDHLLHQILSHGPIEIKEVIETSVLSKRWRYLWTSFPYLDFGINGDGDDDKGKTLRVINFVNQFLLRRASSPIITFRFILCSDIDANLLEGMIYYALQHQVQDLEIYSRTSNGPVKFPSRFCNSLTTLTLDDDEGKRMNLPKSFGLPSLKNLQLSDFIFDGNVLSTCPNLQTLTLFRICHPDENGWFNIHALNLKSFEYIDTRDYISACSIKIMIFAPKLEKFKFSGYIPFMCSVKSLSSLSEIDIEMRLSSSYEYAYVKGKDLTVGLIKMLNQFYNAKLITINWDTIGILACLPDELNKYRGQFPSLKYLKLKNWPYGSIPGCILTYFLNSSTFLKLEGATRLKFELRC